MAKKDGGNRTEECESYYRLSAILKGNPAVALTLYINREENDLPYLLSEGDQ